MALMDGDKYLAEVHKRECRLAKLLGWPQHVVHIGTITFSMEKLDEEIARLEAGETTTIVISDRLRQEIPCAK